MRFLLLSFFTLLLVPAFAQEDFTLYFTGDLGTNPDEDRVRTAMERSYNRRKGNKGVVFLGNLLYPNGMPEVDHANRKEAEQHIRAWAEISEGAGRVFFTPGDRDWDHGRKHGWEKVKRLSRFVDSLNIRGLEFQPKRGCPGPVEIPLNRTVTLVMLDLNWILYPWEKPTVEDNCVGANISEMLFLIEDILKRNANKRVILASHHTLRTYGPRKSSVLPSYQDLGSPTRYKPMIRAIDKILNRYPDVVWIASHDHSLQYIRERRMHYVVAGSATTTAHVKKKLKGKQDFAASQMGYGILQLPASGEVNLQLYNYKEELLFEKFLFEKRPDKLEFLDEPNFKGDTVVTNASDRYAKRKTGFAGANYRDVWSAPVDFPVFDIGTEKGGMEILKRGGGQQTRSLRLQAEDGHQYVLRSIEKYAQGAVPPILRSTIAADLIQDQISASHPYAAYVIPTLADAAGIYHTNPRRVFIPDDPRFGTYQVDFANTVALFEERPAKNWKGYASFGGARKIISTPDLLEDLADDNDNYVDQQWVLKSRLFDMFIADWDRHDDQWRWARFKLEDDEKMFRPIPRDRDQAFFVNDGLLMTLVGRKWIMPKFQGFDYNIKHVPEFNFNARHFDRSFMTELSLSDFQIMADSLQQRLTDEVIEQAIRQWPDTVYELSGEEVIAKLKSQRNNLKRYATEYYLSLAEGVDVVGSNKRELFEVERRENGDTEVRVRKISKKGNTDKVLYHRTFIKDETKEIRLYGLEGEDVFRIGGSGKKGILVRTIGGEGRDVYTDSSHVRGWVKRSIFYDTKEGNEWTSSGETKDKTSHDPAVNVYNRKGFQYNVLIPLVVLNYNVDDGIFLGGGFLATNYGFRKEPFKSRHQFQGSVAFATWAFQFNYDAHWNNVFGKWGIDLEVLAQTPNYVSNFFGIGNETEFNMNADEDFNLDRSIDYYRTRYNLYTIRGLMEREFGKNLTLGFGVHFQAFEAEEDYDGERRFITDFGDSTNFDFKWYQGLVLRLDYDTRNSKILPLKGWHVDLDLRGYRGLAGGSEDYTRFMGSVSYFNTFQLPARFTVGITVGGGHNFGDYEFFQAQILSGLTNLRGYRKTRFFGDSKFYNNVEIRTPLATINTKFIPFTVGLTLFNDVGRVWVTDDPSVPDGERSTRWHYGYGGGIWLAPVNAFVLSLDVANSPEETLLYFKFGFRF